MTDLSDRRQLLKNDIEMVMFNDGDTITDRFDMKHYTRISPIIEEVLDLWESHTLQAIEDYNFQLRTTLLEEVNTTLKEKLHEALSETS